MTKRTNRVRTQWAVRLTGDGKCYLRDLQENVYEIQLKNGTPIGATHWNRIIEDKMGFWDIAKTYRLVIGEYVV